jgi:ABC-type amino acid transport substrate-binding protein
MVAASMLVCVLGLVCVNAARAAGDAGAARLGVCLDDDNPPFSSHAALSGIDVELARALAKALKRELEFTWVTITARGGIGRALKESIQAGRCDLFMGLPVDEDTAADLAARKLEGSTPYLALGYLLVSAPGTAPLTLDKARKARRFGAVTATPADLYLHKEKLNRVPYGNNAELMQALQNGEVDAALIWSPALGGLQPGDAGHAPVVARDQVSDPILKTRMLIAVRTSATGLAGEVDAALAQLRSDGAIRALSEAQRLPWLVP